MLEDVRIVEIGEGMAVQVAGLLLAELGADVLKIEPPDGDPARGAARFANWNRAKRSLALDLAGDAAAVRRALYERLDGADALIHQFPPTRARSLGLDDAALSAAFPRLVVCGITGSPIDHPDVERSNDDLLVGARLGMFYENDGYRPGPIVVRHRMGAWSAAHLAAAGVLARLVVRLQTGAGGAAHTSILQGFLSALPLAWGRNSEGPMPNPPVLAPDRWRGGALTQPEQQLFECKGGNWLQIMDPTQQFDYATMPGMWEVLAEGINIDTPDGVVAAFKRRTREDWLVDLRAADVASEAVARMGEVLMHPETLANGYLIDVDDPDLGRTRQPNTPYHTEDGLPHGHPAPRLGEGADQPWRPRAEAAGQAAMLAHPLTGLRVLDFGMFLAGPMAPSLLGDMGADVIKVEALSGDRMRFMHRYFQASARSKRSLALDLTRPEGREVLQRLLAWAELVHHNMRFRNAEKLGLGEAAIRAGNPGAMFHYVSAYGQRGSRGDWPGYDPIFNAVGGWALENAGEDNPPVFNRFGSLDILTAQSCLVAMLASLYHRRTGGPAIATQTSMLGIAVLTQSELLIGADGKPTPTYHLDHGQYGFSPYHRIYRCEGDWIAVAAHQAPQRDAMRQILGVDEGSFVDVCATRSGKDLATALEAAGVPCEIVTFTDAMNRFFDNPEMRARGLVTALPHPVYGIVEQPGGFWNFGDLAMNIVRAAPTIGQHSDEILRELDYSDEQIAQLRAAMVVA